MPTISRFYGIVIRMFFNEHAPPHFHAEYGDFTAEIAIDTLQILVGELPRRAGTGARLGRIASHRVARGLGLVPAASPAQEDSTARLR
jgi:hypothetical protein